MEDTSTTYIVIFIVSWLAGMIGMLHFIYIIFRLARRVWYKEGFGAMLVRLFVWPSLFVYWWAHRSDAGLRSLRRQGTIALVAFVVAIALGELAKYLS